MVLLGASTALLLVVSVAAASDPQPAPVASAGPAVGAAPTVATAPLAAAPGGEPVDPRPAPDGEPPAQATTAAAAPPAAPRRRAGGPPGTASPPPPAAPSPTAAAPTTTTPPPPTTSWGPIISVPPQPAGPHPNATIATGPGSWTSSAAGITTNLRITPAAPRAGEVVHFAASATYTGGGCCFIALNPGSGTMALSDGGPDRCLQAIPSRVALDADRLFPDPGSIMVHVQVSVMPCGPSPPAPAGTSSLPMASLQASLTIAPAA